MASRVLSIFLGSEVVKVCEVMLAGKKKVQVFNAIDLMIPSGLCEDGVIKNVRELAAAIREGLNGEGFTAKRIVFTVNSKRIANKEVTIPFVKEQKIRDIIKINASEYFPISNLDAYTLNYSVLEIIDLDGMKQYRLSVTATPIEMIEDYYALAKAMGMAVESIDFAGNSILQLLKLQATNSVCAILQMGNENTVVNIMNGSVLAMQRSVPYGRATIAEAVMEARGCSDEQADDIMAEEDIADLAESDENIADAVRILFNSISRILDFYSNRNADAPIADVKLIGDASSIYGLAELFSKESDKPIELIDTLQGVEIKNRNNVSDEIAANYLSNIGAVIEPINVTMEAVKKNAASSSSSGNDKIPIWAPIVAFGIAALCIAGCVVILFTEQNKGKEIQNNINLLGDVENLERQYLQSKQELQTLKDWYVTTQGANESLLQFFTDLEEVQPSCLSIDNFASNQGEFTIRGVGIGKRACAQFEMELKKLPYIDDVHMEVVREAIDEEYGFADNFTVTFKLLNTDVLAAEQEEEAAAQGEASEMTEGGAN